MSKFHLEVAKLKEILLKNGYPKKIIDACVFKFLNKFLEPKSVTLTVPKKELFIVLPFIGSMSGVIKTGLSKALQKRLPFCKLRVIFKYTDCLKSYFNFKDILPEPLRSCQIYKFTCGSCSASYTGKTFWYLKKGFLNIKVCHLEQARFLKVLFLLLLMTIWSNVII